METFISSDCMYFVIHLILKHSVFVSMHQNLSIITSTFVQVWINILVGTSWMCTAHVKNSVILFCFYASRLQILLDIILGGVLVAQQVCKKCKNTAARFTSQ